MTARVALALALVVAVALASWWRTRASQRVAARPLPEGLNVASWLPSGGWLVLSTPWCVSCGPAADMLGALGDGEVVRVDVTDEPDLARRADARTAPTALRVDAVGAVSLRLDGIEAVKAFVASAVPAAGAV